MGIKKSQIGAALGQTTAPVDLAKQTTPTTLANKVRLYSKDVSGVAEFFIKDDGGNEVQITSGGELIAATALATTGDPVSNAAADPPTTGQVLTAINSTTSAWQTLSEGEIVAKARVSGDGVFIYNEGFSSAGKNGTGFYQISTNGYCDLNQFTVSFAQGSGQDIWLINFVIYGGVCLMCYFYKWDDQNKTWVLADPVNFDVIMFKPYTSPP